METKLKTTGEAIRYYRKKIFMKQNELAERLDCQPNEITNYEADKVRPDLPRFVKICKILNMSTKYYFAEYLNLESVNFVAEQKIHGYLTENPLPETADALEFINLIFQSKNEVNKEKLINLFKMLLLQPDEKLQGVTTILEELVQYVAKPEKAVISGKK
jgi:transcriptional regulator with XRE-family HTH domain